MGFKRPQVQILSSRPETNGHHWCLFVFLFRIREDLNLKEAKSVKKVAGGNFFSFLVCRRVPKGKAFRSSNSQGANGDCILSSRPRRSKVRFASTFLCKKSHPPASLLLLFHKKSRLARLFSCKRLHDDSLSLPTFL